MEKDKQHVGLSQRGALFFCIDTIMSSFKKLVPREGDEKGEGKVLGIFRCQVMKGQEYRSIQQVKKRRPICYFYKLLYRVIAA
jgi:hypothetical protein